MSKPAGDQCALVVLPFADAAAAQTFVALVHGQTQGTTQPLVALGALYEYEVEDQRFQVVEFHGRWEGFDDPGHGALVQRPITVVEED